MKLENYNISTEWNPYWESNSFSASLEIPRILWAPEVHYHIYIPRPPAPVLSQVSLVHRASPTPPLED